MQEKNSRGTALITGASEGIGLELARIMADDGWNLVITARREDRLILLAEELKVNCGVNVTVIPGDLGKAVTPDMLHSRISELGIRIDALVNNAGFGYYGEFRNQDIDRNLDMIQVNISSLVKLTHLFLPGMIARGSGRIMNVGSVVSYFALPLNSIYAATKAFVLSFSIALAQEIKGSGITMTCLCPGTTRSGFSRVAGSEHTESGFYGLMNADTVALQGYRAMMSGRGLIVNGLFNKLMTFLTRFLPRNFYARAAMGVMKKRSYRK